MDTASRTQAPKQVSLSKHSLLIACMYSLISVLLTILQNAAPVHTFEHRYSTDVELHNAHNSCFYRRDADVRLHWHNRTKISSPEWSRSPLLGTRACSNLNHQEPQTRRKHQADQSKRLAEDRRSKSDQGETISLTTREFDTTTALPKEFDTTAASPMVTEEPCIESKTCTATYQDLCTTQVTKATLTSTKAATLTMSSPVAARYSHIKNLKITGASMLPDALTTTASTAPTSETASTFHPTICATTT
ncbi:hypothetical protein M758_UG102500 [Ceratodon purpureus]|nr:hypothetical protein M758_UG102500 [Ceratodon purpureus]